jgi:hypothetical protein
MKNGAGKEVIPPRLLERECDAMGWDEETQEQTRKVGCGTRWQWWLGYPCACPKCGFCYQVTQEMLDSGELEPTVGIHIEVKA